MNICYLLGAGFSAPLGLPVVSNFFEKSKDQYQKNKNEYHHFLEVFNKVKSLSYAHNYFSTDLFNIEEILSILEMESRLTRRKFRDKYVRYIRDVINYHTPDIAFDGEPGKMDKLCCIFGDRHLDKIYGNFVACLIGLIGRPDKEKGVYFIDKRRMDSHYSVITMNYDCIIEKYLSVINNALCISNSHLPERSKIADFKVDLFKLHGCAMNGAIIPPTWSKRLNKDIIEAWSGAYKALSNANYLRILGYSLPEGDAYIRYLFKASILNSENLKGIEVITIDGDKKTKMRYGELIKFNNYKFYNVNVERYLGSLFHIENNNFNADTHLYTNIEAGHKSFVESLENDNWFKPRGRVGG